MAGLESKRITTLPMSYRSWRSLARSLTDRELPSNSDVSRVAIVGTSTLDQLAELLPVAGLHADLKLEVHAAGYAQYESELLDPASATYEFQPSVIVLAPDSRSIELPSNSSDPESAIDREFRRWTAAWSAVRQHSEAHLLQLNFVPPFERPLGSHEAQAPGSRRRVVLELNRRIADAAGSDVHIVDTFSVALEYGLSRFSDDRYWHHSKQAVALGALPWLATEIASVVRAALGRSRKCLVVDLDNTIWGGVVGEDGPEGLRLSGDAEGEAYLALQDYLLDLKHRGVLLAVCSKNDEDAARAPFLERDDMRLSLDDFVAFIANWEPKPTSLRRLANDLNLGLDAFAFLDDNPAERDFVRQELPEIDVIELTEDPASYLRTLATYRGFEVVRVSNEDLARTDHYRARSAAKELSETASSLDEFLTSLQMVADLRQIDATNLQRVAQLINKTNQWNLTTRRRSVDELTRFLDDPATISVCASLTDRFTDHGLVGVLLAARENDVIEIDTFLMSCRVIGRTLEHAMFEALLDEAEANDVAAIVGTYHPTSKNSSVAETYGCLGFDLADTTAGSTRWRFDIGSSEPEPNRFISRKDQREP